MPSEGHLGHLQTLTMTNEAVICIFLSLKRDARQRDIAPVPEPTSKIVSSFFTLLTKEDTIIASVDAL